MFSLGICKEVARRRKKGLGIIFIHFKFSLLFPKTNVANNIKKSNFWSSLIIFISITVIVIVIIIIIIIIIITIIIIVII